MLDRLFGANQPAWLLGLTHSLLRAVTGAMYTQHGVQKLFGLLTDPRRPSMGTPAAFSLFWFGGVIETFGGVLIVLGLFTRPVAFLVAGEMAVVYFKFHAPNNLFPILNGGEVVVLFCSIFLFMFAAGPGPYSVDALVRGRNSK
ncbi:MAG: DoxX family protein [Gemmatimonadaceae bacterium]